MDEGIRVGQEITPYYDPLLGKLITWGNDRQTAIRRMIRALGEFHIAGIETSIPFCLRVIQHKSFQEGKYSTHTLNAIKNELQKELTVNKKEQHLEARIGAVQSHHQLKPELISRENQQQKANWASAGRKDELR